MRRRWLVAWSGCGLVAAVLGGCAGDDAEGAGGGIQPIEVEDAGAEGEPESEPEPEPAVEVEPEPEPDAELESEPAAEAEADDPFAFDDPSEIDADYVDRVMAELFPRFGGVLAGALRRDLGVEPDDSDYEQVAALFTGPRLGLVGQNLLDYSSDGDLRAGFVPLSELRQPIWSTLRVIHADALCLVAVGTYDLSDVSVEPFPDDELTALVLAAMDASEQRRHESNNPTGWRIHEQAQLVRGAGREPVAATELDALDYENGLPLPCESFEVRS